MNTQITVTLLFAAAVALFLVSSLVIVPRVKTAIKKFRSRRAVAPEPELTANERERLPVIGELGRGKVAFLTRSGDKMLRAKLCGSCGDGRVRLRRGNSYFTRPASEVAFH